MLTPKCTLANMYGGLGCFGTAIVRSDAASVWATGNSWWQVPRMAKIEFTGSLPAGVTVSGLPRALFQSLILQAVQGKDVIIALSGLFK